MSKLVVLIVIVLGVLAIAQLVRLYELSSKFRDRREEDIPNRDNRLNATLMLTFCILLFIGFIWMMIHYGYAGRGPAASINGESTDWLLNLNFFIIIAVFFLTNSLLFFFSYKYVRTPGVKAYFFPHDNRLELIWTVVPALVLAVIIILGLKSWNEQTDDASKEAVRIELFSKQFDWTVRMSGNDNKLGYFDYKLTNDNNPLALMTSKTIQDAIDSMEMGASGIRSLAKKLNDRTQIFVPEERDLMMKDLDRKERMIRLLHQMKAHHNAAYDAMALDDIVFNANDTLVLCKGQDYEFNFRAKDVIHSAYFPHFRAQMNTVPGMTTRFKFTPKYTTTEMRKLMHNEQFNFILMCNKICGGSHYKMKLIIVVLDKGAYKKWYDRVNGSDMATNKTFANVYAVGKPKAETKEPANGSVPSADSLAANPAVTAATPTAPPAQ